MNSIVRSAHHAFGEKEKMSVVMSNIKAPGEKHAFN